MAARRRPSAFQLDQVVLAELDMPGVAEADAQLACTFADLTWLKLVRTAVVDAGEGIAEVVG
jgi:hypothetical protein